MALTHVWITRGPNAGRTLMMTEADASAAVAGNWASETEIGATVSDEDYAEMHAKEFDRKSYQAYQEKLDDPTYTPQGEDDGSWPPAPPEEVVPPPENIIDNTLPDIPDPEKPPPGTEPPPLGGSRSAEDGGGATHVTVSKRV